MSTYAEHEAFLVKQEAGAIAEMWGFRAARWQGGGLQYSKDSYIQGRFEQGLRDGQTILRVEGHDADRTAKV